jgi:beta-glucosidase/6-phospho-beta-glucosidase/beta-galactosidase
MKKLTDQEIEEIRENPDWTSWTNICRYFELSEIFIEEFQDKVDWYFVFKNQKLSEEFLIRFINRVDFWPLKYNNNLSQELKDKIRVMKGLMEA